MTSTNPVDLNDPNMKWIVALAEGFKRAGATHSPIEPDPEVIYRCIQGAIRNAKGQPEKPDPTPMPTHGKPLTDEQLLQLEKSAGPTVGFRQCPTCKAGFHANCPGGEWADPTDKSKGHYICSCGCEAAA